MSRDKLAVIFARPPTPQGWGWDTLDEFRALVRAQEKECRSYAERHGLRVDSVIITPHDAPPITRTALYGIGHIIVSDCAVVPDLGVLCTLCGANNVHLHEACSDTAVTNWKQ